MRPSLNNREGLLAVGDSYPSDQKSSMISAAKQVRHYIGTIEIPGIARGTGCLLEDGRILTCLHNILDYDALDERKAELIDFEAHDVAVYFVKDDEIFRYKINSAPVTGINHLKASQLSSWCFDYAFLETEGNPVRDLGGGFKLDQTNHFGSAFASDPAQTLAISGPFIKMTEDGNLKAYRYVSLSENQAAQSQYYHITQAGDHPSAPGFSGMGMVPVDSSYSVDTLYAIHSYRDNQGQQTGAKISEIRSSMRDKIIARDDARLDPHVINILKNWYETLMEATINSNRSVSPGNVINFEQAVQMILSGHGNYLSDIVGRTESRAEARGPMEEAVRRKGGTVGAIIDHSTPHNPGHKQELPHLHHPSHDAPQGNPIHAFYDTGYWVKKAAEEQEAKRRLMKTEKDN